MTGVRPGKNLKGCTINTHLNIVCLDDILIFFSGNIKDALNFLIFQIISYNNNLNGKQNKDSTCEAEIDS